MIRGGFLPHVGALPAGMVGRCSYPRCSGCVLAVSAHQLPNVPPPDDACTRSGSPRQRRWTQPTTATLVRGSAVIRMRDR